MQSKSRRRGLFEIIKGLFSSSVKQDQGSQRPIGSFYDGGFHGSARGQRSRIARNYDLRIKQNPVRDEKNARFLLELGEYCLEVDRALDIGVANLFSSHDGDVGRLQVSPFFDADSSVSVDPRIYGLASDSLRRLFPHSQLKQIARQVILYGDAFGFLVLRRGAPGLEKVLLLPPWECFRVEDDLGNLQRFEQRRHLADANPSQFNPQTVAHWRHNPDNLYGRSQFASCFFDWQEYKKGMQDLADVRRAQGYSPTFYEFEPGTTPGQIQKLKEAREVELEEGVTPEVFLLPGTKVIPPNGKADLTPLLNDLNGRRLAIIRASGEPIWQFPGFDTTGARDISGQPAMANSRQVGDRRLEMGEGILQVIRTDLLLQLGPDEFARLGGDRLRLQWPEFFVDVQAQSRQQLEDSEDVPPEDDDE